MSRRLSLALLALGSLAVSHPARSSDSVLDWNTTFCNITQHDGTNAVNKANPGWITRSAAMMNGAIYDAFQAIDRTHAPYLVNIHAAPNTSRDAAVNQAAYETMLSCYPGEGAILSADYQARMALIPDGPEKTSGIALGTQIAQTYIAARAGDHASDSTPYTPGTGVGAWRPDPFHPAQVAWGPGWGTVNTFGIPDTASFIAQLPPLPALDSPEYAAAYNQVKDYGDRNSVVRTAEQTEIGLFWAYDRATMGPPPVLYIQNLKEIGEQAGNTPEQNARMFAMASVAQADAAVAAWDAKFTYNFWRPVGAIHDGDLDGNPATVGDPNWRPLGAPGPDPNDYTDDFTPPFPAWTSGHATMGAAIFKSIELFYGTNSFDAIDGTTGNGSDYTLHSAEFDANHVAGMARTYSTFTQTGPIGIGLENSPEGENATSRIYLGIHWIMDQRDGTQLGHDIAEYVQGHYFQAVPEPSGDILAGILTVWGAAARSYKRRQAR